LRASGNSAGGPCPQGEARLPHLDVLLLACRGKNAAFPVICFLGTLFAALSGYRAEEKGEAVGEIKRLGDPKTVLYKFAVTLSGTPPRTWLRRFRQAAPTTGTFHPRHVTCSGNTLTFVSADPDPGLWLRHLDAWIDTANGGAPPGRALPDVVEERSSIHAVTRKLDELLKE
jgi:hypothetical protein